jgi:hypothetical protein
VASGATNLKPFTLTNASDTISGAGAIGAGDQTLKLSNQSNATIDADGSNTLTIHTGNAITNSGTLEATGSGGLVIDDAVTNSGTIEANGGNVTIGGNLSASGKTGVAQIFSGSHIELKGTLNTAAVSFQNNVGNSGSLTLDHSATTGATNGFKGTLAGFYGDGSSSDTLDLQDINFAGGVTWSF